MPPISYAIEGELWGFDELGRSLGSITPVTAVQLGWKRNGWSAATFKIPAGSLRYSTAYIREWYRVEFRSSQLPVVWVGIMLDPLPLGAEATISCMSAEFLFDGRYTDYWYDPVGSPGAIAMGLYNQAIRRHGIGVQLGDIDRSGPEYYFLYQLKQISAALDDLCKATGGDYWIEKTTPTNSDPWLFRFSLNRGIDRSAEVLISGEIVDKPDYKRAGSGIKTFAYVLGGGISDNLWDRIKLEIPDPVAMEVYGYIETVIEFKEIIDVVLLREAGTRGLMGLSKPARMIGLNMDNRFAGFGTFWLGDTIRVVASNLDWQGLDKLARVDAIQLDLDAQKMGLVLELVS